MDLEERLKSWPQSVWTTGQAIILDWYDGPRAGICALAEPAAEFAFELLDERPTDDGLDDRLFRISALPPGTVDRTLAALHELGGPRGPVWTPVWRFASEEARQRAEGHLETVTAQKRPTSLVIHTRDMQNFLGCCQLELPGQSNGDWFAAIAQVERPTRRSDTAA